MLKFSTARPYSSYHDVTILVNGPLPQEIRHGMEVTIEGLHISIQVIQAQGQLGGPPSCSRVLVRFIVTQSGGPQREGQGEGIKATWIPKNKERSFHWIIL